MARPAVHWFAPVSSAGSLLAALGFMVAHHLFYRSLQGAPVSDDAPFGFAVSQQQVNIAVGTAFAFLAKACMVVAISVAFVQIFWHGIHHARSLETAPTLERVDAVHATMDNAFEMFNARSWLAHPALMLIAGLSWLVPVASVLTPSTLSVSNARVDEPPTRIMRVPNIDFHNLDYLAQMPDTKLASLGTFQGPAPYYYAYAGGSDDLLKISNAVTGNGAILPITPPGINASWNLEFNGPSLECNEIPRTSTLGFADDFADYLKHSNNGGNSRNYGYVAWYPTVGAKGLEIPTGVNCTKQPNACPLRAEHEVLTLGSLVPSASQETLNRTSKALEIMVLMTSFTDPWDYQANIDSSLKLLSCQLYNATYQVALDYSGGSQKIQASTSRNRGEGPIQHIPGVLHKYMDQQTDYYMYPCDWANATKLRCCYNHPGLSQTLTYQAIMDAFAQKLQGVIYMDLMPYANSPGGGAGTTFFVNTTLMQTKLARSKDLGYLRSALQSESAHTKRMTFQAALQTNNMTVVADPDGFNTTAAGYGDDARAQLGTEMSLGDAIEEVFRNLTISLMSSEALQPNYSSATAPPPAKVTFLRYQNVYSYSAHNLWLPYGIAFGLTAIAVAAGVLMMFINQASYSNNFSTVLRAAHGAQLSTSILKEDVHGQDPLPRYLGRAQILLRRAEQDMSTAEMSSEQYDERAKTAMSSGRLLGREWSASGHDSSR